MLVAPVFYMWVGCLYSSIMAAIPLFHLENVCTIGLYIYVTFALETKQVKFYSVILFIKTYLTWCWCTKQSYLLLGTLVERDFYLHCTLD